MRMLVAVNRTRPPRVPLGWGLAVLLTLCPGAARGETTPPEAAAGDSDAQTCRDGALALYRDRCGVPVGSRAAAQAEFEWDTLRGFGYEPGRMFELATTIPGDCPYISFKTAIMSLDRKVEKTTGGTDCVAVVPAEEPASAGVAPAPTTGETELRAREAELQERAFDLFFENCPVDRGSAFGQQAPGQWNNLLKLGQSPARIAQLAALLTPDCQYTALDAAILAMGLQAPGAGDPKPLLPLNDDEWVNDTSADGGGEGNGDTGEDLDLLAEPEWDIPDRVPAGAPAALMALGTGLYLGGFASAAVPDAGYLHRGHPVRIALTVNLLTVGLPTAVAGGILLGRGYSEVDNPNNLETWRRAEIGKQLQLPYVIMGLAMTGTGVGMVVWGTPLDDMARSGEWLIPFAGISTLTAGLLLSAMGDAAAGELFGREHSWDDAPGRLLAKAGVAFMAVGGGAVALGGLVVMPFELAFNGDGSLASKLMLTGAPFLAAGVPMLIAGIQRSQRAERQYPGIARTDRPRPSLLGIAPLHDPHTGTTGLSMTWAF